MTSEANVEANKVWDEFLATWPIDRLRSMSLEEYTKAGSKDTFTYWMEARLEKLGSIWGGSAFKFGIYSRADKTTKPSTESEIYDEEYAWSPKYGATRDEAFQAVRARVLAVAEAAQKGDLAAIGAVDLGRAYKWKIAFHYQNREVPTILDVFKPEPLAVFLGLKPSSSLSMSDLYPKALAQREQSEDLLDFARRVYEPWSKRQTIWKFSHGPAIFGEAERATLLERHLLVMHKETGWGQGVEFMDDARIGELVYLCHGNSVQLLGRITSTAKPYEKDDGGFFARAYEPLRNAISHIPFEANAQKWTPRGNSTFWQVPKGALKEFEHLILKPYFGLDLPQLEGLEGGGEAVTPAKGGEEPEPVIEPVEFDYPLNLILYGPPGTGKTYATVAQAMSIVDGQPYDLAELGEKYEELKKRFDRYMLDGQVAFVTFHQSYSYEEFIEGIRPTRTGGLPSYEVQPGVLRIVAERARENYDKSLAQADVTSGGAKDFETAYDKMVEAINESDTRRVQVKLYKGALAEVTQAPRAQGFTVTVPSYPSEFNVAKSRLRDLWPRRQTIKRPADVGAYSDSFLFAILKHLETIVSATMASTPDPMRRFVLVIDEINRGNIARILGELITLLEPDKRVGCPNALSVTLPYSQESFGLPPNLYVLGTMNTADRSIALLDTALRRRFAFQEMLPIPELLAEDVDGVNLRLLLQAMNQRIQFLYDRDHTIGHSYLMGVKTFSDLTERLTQRIIPLLQEYFYDDWSKLQLVFRDDGRPPNEQVILDAKLDPVALFGKSAEDLDEKVAYRVNDRISLQAVTKVYM